MSPPTTSGSASRVAEEGADGSRVKGVQRPAGALGLRLLLEGPRPPPAFRNAAQKHTAREISALSVVKLREMSRNVAFNPSMAGH